MLLELFVEGADAPDGVDPHAEGGSDGGAPGGGRGGEPGYGVASTAAAPVSVAFAGVAGTAIARGGTVPGVS